MTTVAEVEQGVAKLRIIAEEMLADLEAHDSTMKVVEAKLKAINRRDAEKSRERRWWWPFRKTRTSPSARRVPEVHL